MNKKASFELSTEYLVKLILGLVMIVIVISFFADFIPFLSNQPLLGKVVMLFAVIFLYFTITDILIHMNL